MASRSIGRPLQQGLYNACNGPLRLRAGLRTASFFAAPVLLQHRLSTTDSQSKPKLQSITAAQNDKLLASQRRSRPVSPHLSIYQPQIHWVSGGIMRNCAIILTAPIYIFGAAYLVSPLMGWHLDTASLVEWFGSLSVGTRLAIKGFFGFPFVFHIVHGLKHLVWDTGAMLTNRQVWLSGWIGMGISVIGTVGLMFW
ncbi:cytochrome b subunit of succinate dehydrogenase, Sdh3p [Elasticomyces elasticus]|uniref:Cytochrome b subunit of succinate dehydrogenase, Sdh3p n=1 Tax=Exophiala sideris TaxID=1016849 RepID=A0ABR0IYI4_9EURO|nr:cytochrome b subunit of succinate dehydrogenase, Sdh3p [Elasticomyces elasticus]KAK5022354.1 cytochrome b subunit of succinate dehydrogenase, Sdh3p [Exophiala sideris]KAK5027166.1 cytochrome b subunit of succinate dehydrogenase, Sdh3p [Exophiala sideris]KAK5051741.1 cytochrome b subunit of succinate dehydrogenase, Sdh3p [Exophiala sideris]KAK5177706.1 cytochrome b subunit of succinate dehydrogenase, Sdh3p [Eurotiomycetes sp. CCFEE 6388]